MGMEERVKTRDGMGGTKGKDGMEDTKEGKGAGERVNGRGQDMDRKEGKVLGSKGEVKGAYTGLMGQDSRMQGMGGRFKEHRGLCST